MFDVLGLYASYALTITFGKAAMNYAQPLFFVGIRLLISAPFLLGYVYFFKRDKFSLKKEHINLFVQSTVMLYLGYALGFWALKNMNSSKNALFFTLTPFITALLVYLLYGEKLTKKQLLGLMIGLLGAVPALLIRSGEPISSIFLLFGLPEIAAIVAIATGPYRWILANTLIKQHEYIPFFINGICMMFCCVPILLTSLLLNFDNAPLYTQLAPFIGYVLFLSFISDFIAYNWYMILLKKYTTTFLAFAGFTVPLYVAIYSWLWLGEAVSWPFFVSFILIFIGLFIFYQDELNRSMVKKS
ncbi:MAG: DMT family transporter [Candidatus Babeliales bacterium]|nr:DMT family transporter [Candidatus Babeliales bacterium]